MPSSSRVVTSEQSSKNYEVLNTDDNISAWLAAHSFVTINYFLQGFQSRSAKRVWRVKSSMPDC